MFTIELRLPPGVNKISTLAPHIKANVTRALEEGMNLVVRESQTKYLTGPRPEKLGVVTGLLRSRIMSKVVAGGEGAFAEGILGVSNVVYAWIHEMGGKTKPHPIVARNAPYLVFYWKKIGKWMKIKRVNHPGSKIPARPYLLPALENTLQPIQGLLQSAIDRAYRTT